MSMIQTPGAGHQKLMQYLPHHTLGDQPTTCPRCGRRTEDDHFVENMQICHCMGCHYTFIGEFE